MDYNLLKTFSKVAELGSFTQASIILKQPKSRVSRAISRLEQELGVELIRRTTRKSSLTDIGRQLYKNVTPHLTAINNELISVGDMHTDMSGTIRITTTDSLAQTLLTKVISKFNSLYPSVNFEMIITNDYVDLVKEDVDLAFRAGKLKDSSLIQKKFVELSFILVCSKEYAESYQLPSKLEELSNHKFFSFIPLEKYFINKNIQLNSALRTDSLPMLLSMALNSRGVTVLPEFLCSKHIESKELVRVVPEWHSKKESVHILYPPTKNQSKRIKEFISISKSMYS